LIYVVQTAEHEKNKKDQGNTNNDARHGRLRSLSDLLFRADVSGSSSQEGREDSDYDDDMELDFDTSVSGDESRDSDPGAAPGSLSLRFHRREDEPNEQSVENRSIESTSNGDSAYEVLSFFLILFLYLIFEVSSVRYSVWLCTDIGWI
jgi:WD and tetratricopeptide repeat-containing protein 1